MSWMGLIKIITLHPEKDMDVQQISGQPIQDLLRCFSLD